MNKENFIFTNNKVNTHRILFYLVLFVIVFNYYGINWHYWFLSVFDKYTFPSWILPLSLFYVIMCVKLFNGDLSVRLSNVKKMHFVLACFVISCAISLFIHGHNFYQIGIYFILTNHALVLYGAIFLFLTNNNDIEKILKVLFFLGLIFCLYQIFIHYIIGYQFLNFKVFELKHLFSDKISVVDYSLDFYPDEEGRNMRLSFPGLGCTPFATALGPLVILGIYYAQYNKGAIRFFYYIASFFMIFNMAQTGSRMPIIALGVSVLIFVRHLYKKITYVIAAISLVIVFIMLNPHTKGRFSSFISSVAYYKHLITENSGQVSIMSIIEEIPTAHLGGAHFDTLAVTIPGTIKSPIFGMGPGSYYSGSGEYAIEHNRFNEILITQGLIVAIPYLIFIILLIAASRRMLLNSFKKTYGISSYNIGIVFYPVTLMAALNLINRTYDDFYWIIFGLAASWIRNLAYNQYNRLNDG